jgi:hypothetical protein
MSDLRTMTIEGLCGRYRWGNPDGVLAELRRRDEAARKLVEACRKADVLPEEIEREGETIVEALRASSNRGMTAPAASTFQRWARKFADIRAALAQFPKE